LRMAATIRFLVVGARGGSTGGKSFFACPRAAACRARSSAVAGRMTRLIFSLMVVALRFWHVVGRYGTNRVLVDLFVNDNDIPTIFREAEYARQSRTGTETFGFIVLQHEFDIRGREVVLKDVIDVSIRFVVSDDLAHAPSPDGTSSL
jgi:hypothetical protein